MESGNQGERGTVPLDQVAEVLRRAIHGDECDPTRPRAYVAGTDENGNHVVMIQDGQTVYELRVADLSVLSMLAGPPLKPARDPSQLAVPYAPRTWTSPGTVEHPATDHPVSLVRAGPTAQAMPSLEATHGQALGAALFTCRGPTLEAQGVEYKPLNEDGVVVRLRPGDRASGRPEILSVGAFDQAGGEGASSEPGAASEAAARCFEEAGLAIEEGTAPDQALREAVTRASTAVRRLGVGAMTTFAGAVLIAHPRDGGWSCQVHVAVVGDSRVLLFDSAGALKHVTKLHNVGARIAAGESNEAPPSLALRFANALSRGIGSDDDTPDLYVWDVQPGDRVVVETDGLGDAHELEQMPANVWHADHCAEMQGRVLGSNASPQEAVATLVGYALDQMADRYGKPDNIGVAVAQRTA